MSNWGSEAEAREQIKAMVAEYYHDFKEKKDASITSIQNIILFVFDFLDYQLQFDYQHSLAFHFLHLKM